MTGNAFPSKIDFTMSLFICVLSINDTGGQLMLAAGRRCLRAGSEVGGVVLAIDAKNDRVAAWYITYAAIPLVDIPLSLAIPLTTMAVALKAAGHTL